MALRRESDYIYGIHDRAGAHVLKGKGWVVITEGIGDGPNDWSTASYADLGDQGLGVIVRLNLGYNPKGTIPVVQRYPHFAARCGNFVAGSNGCHIWIIGNEPNLAAERPGGKDGEVVWPTMYANCYRQCRREIRSRQGHEHDQVIVAAVGPWNAETKPWIEYFRDVLWELNVDSVYGFQLDGIALHTYSRGAGRSTVIADTKMGTPFEQWCSGFRAYIDFMEAIPPWARSLPVYITESNQNQPWENRNTGWVRAAYAEINRWNKGLGHQQIRCLALYRWLEHDQWYIDGKGGVLDDLMLALVRGYTWRSQAPAPSGKLTDAEKAMLREFFGTKVPATLKDAIARGREFVAEVAPDLYVSWDPATARYEINKIAIGTWEHLDDEPM